MPVPHLFRSGFFALLAGGCLLGAALDSAALTLGRASGNAWLGQGLDVGIQVQHETHESLANLCFEAEVYHGDTRQAAGQVRVSVEVGSQPQSALVRVRSAVPVDEPVVTVYLRETCISKNSRRYVLLAEVPAEGMAAGLVTFVPPPSQEVRPVAQPASLAPAATASSVGAAAGTAAAPAARPRPAPAARAPVHQASSQAAAAPVDKPVAKLKPRLKIDPLESLSERVANLEAASDKMSQQAPAPAADPRLKKLEDSVQALLAVAARNERGMAELRERLHRAEAEKYDNELVYALGTALLAALGSLAYLWRRQRQSRASADRAAWQGVDEEAGFAETVLPPRTAAAPASAYAPAAAVVQAPAFESLPDPGAMAAFNEAAPVDVAAAPGPEIDLDDLIVPASPSGDASSLPPVEAFPALAPQEREGLPMAEQSEPLVEFPVAGEVTIDVSHLSLSPVEEPPVPTVAAPVPVPEPAAPLLDFDFDLTPPPVGAQESLSSEEPRTKPGS